MEYTIVNNLRAHRTYGYSSRSFGAVFRVGKLYICIYIHIYTLYQVQQYSILTCAQAFAGKSVPVITLMNGNKGRRALYQAILCSLRDVLLRAIHSPLSHPLSPSLALSSSCRSISRPLGTKTVSFAITLWRTVRLTLK